MELSFTSLAILAATGFVAPLAIGFGPRLRLPSVVLEIVLGILIGPLGARLGEGRRAGPDHVPDRPLVPAP